MYFQKVRTRFFRNLVEFEIELHPRLNIISGDNGQGKTNFVEALYLLACQRSFRATQLSEMLSFGEPRAAVFGAARVGQLDYQLAIEIKDGRRRSQLDGKILRPGAAWPAGLTAILFTPDDLRVPRGSPADRRRLLDGALPLTWPAYHQVKRDYDRVLRSRNRLLRDPESSSQSLIDVYGAQLAVIGAKVVAARVRYLRSLHALFTDAFAEVASQSETAAMRYHALWHPQPLDVDDLDRLTSELERAIQQSRAKDFARGATTCGPHHDDVEFELNAHPARQYASQGQTRSLVLAFRIAQILHVYQRSGSYPLLLLDDVSSELDPTRNRHLFERLAAIPCQLLVTTTRADLIPLAADGGARFVIHAGQLSQT